MGWQTTHMEPTAVDLPSTGAADTVGSTGATWRGLTIIGEGRNCHLAQFQGMGHPRQGMLLQVQSRTIFALQKKYLLGQFWSWFFTTGLLNSSSSPHLASGSGSPGRELFNISNIQHFIEQKSSLTWHAEQFVHTIKYSNHPSSLTLPSIFDQHISIQAETF